MRVVSGASGLRKEVKSHGPRSPVSVKPLIPVAPRRPDGRGRPRINDRDVLNGILWIMRTGAPWHDMPDRYPSYQTCHRQRARPSVIAAPQGHTCIRGAS